MFEHVLTPMQLARLVVYTWPLIGDVSARSGVLCVCVWGGGCIAHVQGMMEYASCFWKGGMRQLHAGAAGFGLDRATARVERTWVALRLARPLAGLDGQPHWLPSQPDATGFGGDEGHL